MATLDRIEARFAPRRSSTSRIGITDDETYVGRHRKHVLRALSIRRMFYSPRHRRT